MPTTAPAPLPITAADFPPPGIRGVVFDVVHTLVEPAPTVAMVYHEAGLRHGLDLGPAVIRDRFAAAWKRQEGIDAAATPAHATSRAREIDRWRQIVADVFERAPAAEAIFAELWEHFGRPGAWRPVPRGRELLLAARGAGLPVALASNFDDRLLGLAAAVDPLPLADRVFASSELGWRKPAAEFFRAVERALGLGPEELLLIGDDPVLDIAAARDAGWHARPV